MYEIYLVVGEFEIPVSSYEVGNTSRDVIELKKVTCWDRSVLYSDTLIKMHAKLKVIAKTAFYDGVGGRAQTTTTLYGFDPKGKLEMICQKESD